MNDNRIQVKGTMRGAFEDHNESFRRYYADGEGLKLIETRSVSSESDFSNGRWKRENPDNGRTWSECENIYQQYFEKVGEGDENLNISFDPIIYDPISGNMTICGMKRYFIGEHIEAYRQLWDEGKTALYDHCYLVYRRPDGTVKEQLLAYEDCADFDPENPRSSAYLDNNRAYFGLIQHASNGDLLIPLGANGNKCCKILGLSMEELYPSSPTGKGVILVRAHWEPSREEYSLSYSKPVVINALLSSRGVEEPCVTELKSGRILIVFRGSN